MTSRLTPTERNALAWVQFIEYYDRIKDEPDWVELLKWRVAVQREALKHD